jgi:hypothetical protein
MDAIAVDRRLLIRENRTSLRANKEVRENGVMERAQLTILPGTHRNAG